MLVDLLDGLAAPVGIFLEGVIVLDDLQRMSGTQGHTPVAVDAFCLVGQHFVQLRIVAVHLIGALPLTDTAADAPILIADYFIVRVKKIDSHYALPPSSVTSTHSPPLGDHTLSSSGWMTRIADSSLAT